MRPYAFVYATIAVILAGMAAAHGYHTDVAIFASAALIICGVNAGRRPD